MQQQLDCTKVLIAARANLNAQVEGVDGKAWADTGRQPTLDQITVWKSVQGWKWAESTWPCRRDLKQQGRGLCRDACAYAGKSWVSAFDVTVWRSWRCSGKPRERHHKSGAAECTDATHGVKQPVGLTDPALPHGRWKRTHAAKRSTSW